MRFLLLSYILSCLEEQTTDGWWQRQHKFSSCVLCRRSVGKNGCCLSENTTARVVSQDQ